ncbi:MAG: leucine-rich repeat protein [Lachnospiraceae bacterium]|nr:leucine-rich repeat protein [Lachnospiraceae bacterium]
MRNKRWWNCLMAVVMSTALLIPAPIVSAEESTSEKLEREIVQEMEREEKAQEENKKLQKAEEAKGAGASEGDYTYEELADGTLEITKYTGSGGRVEIPAQIGGKRVTSIGRAAFQLCESLTSVVIPEGVTRLEDSAFGICENLTEVVIPGSLTTIEDGVFYQDSSLASAAIPEGVTSIGTQAFYDCALTKVVIPESVTNIESGAFESCLFTEINVPKNVEYIGESAFANGNLTSIKVNTGNQTYDSRENCNAIIETRSNILIEGCANTHIPEGITSIGDEAFNGCRNLTSIHIPESVTSIGGSAFYGCKSLTGIDIPESVTSIGYYAFANCGLTKIVMPKSVTSIADGIFQGSSELKEIVIPEEVTSIGEGAFYGCKGLTKINIPKNITNIEKDLFRHCASLTELKIPENVTNIGNYAFAYCGFTNIDLPKSVTSIGIGAFSSCKSLTSIEFPENVTSIKGNTFMNCDSLTKIVIPKSVTSIADNMFYSAYGKKNLVIYCYKDSVAHKWAVDNNYVYRFLDGQGQPTPPDSGHSHTYKTTVVKATVSKNGSITKMCSVCGDTIKSTIYYPKTIGLSKTKYIYNGKGQKPSVKVKDSQGKTVASSNYTVSYQKGRKNVGIYTVTVKFKNNYSGSVKKTFTIQPKATKLSSISARSKGFIAKWKKQSSQTTGYEIQYSINGKFKRNNAIKNVKKNKTVSQKISKLKANKKYYVRIRTYKTVKINGKSKKIYSDWSKSKSVRTKR